MKDKITFSNSFGEKYHMPADGPHRVTIDNITHAEPLAKQLKMVLQREADSQRRHDEKVERLEAENERLQTKYDEMGNAMLNHIGKAAAGIVRLELEIDGLKAENERLREALERIASGRYSGVMLTSFPPKDPAVEEARAALGETK